MGLRSRRRSSAASPSNMQRRNRSLSDAVKTTSNKELSKSNVSNGDLTNGDLPNHDEADMAGPHETMDEDLVSIKEEEPSGAAGSYVVSGFRLTFNQFITCLIKRFYFTIRNWKALVSQVC